MVPANPRQSPVIPGPEPVQLGVRTSRAARGSRSSEHVCVVRNATAVGNENHSVDPADVRTPDELAAELTDLRERAGLTVRRLAVLTGIRASTLGGYLAGRHSPSVGNLERMLRACGVTDARTLTAWRDALLRTKRRPGRRAGARPTDPAIPETAAAGAPAPVDRPPSPYRGLASFTDADARRLFGRDELVAAVVDRVREARRAPAGGGLLVVTGASGSGKSSVLRAGVVPALRSAGLLVAVATPGTLPSAAPDVLVVDQLEEVFAAGRPEEEPARVAAAAAAAPVVVAVLRADFTGRALAHTVLADALQRPVVVGPMTPEQLRAVVVGPAEQAGVPIEDGLPELLLRDADAARGLPLLAHALHATWERSTDGRMTVAAYRATGGVAAAVAQSAEEAGAGLPEDAVRRLFLRLVHVGVDAADTGRRVPRDELADVPPDVLDAFVSRRLLVADDESVQLAHEALLSAWPRLRDWIDADRAGLAAHRRFADAARAWGDTADPDLLPRGSALAAAEERARQPAHRGELTRLERRFLAAAVDLRAAERQDERRRRRWRRAAIVSLVVYLPVALGLIGLILHQNQVLSAARDTAVSRQLAVRADALRARDPALAAQLSVLAYRTAQTVEARSSVLDAAAQPPVTRLAGQEAVTRSVGIGGGLLVTAGGVAGGAELWRLGPGRPSRVGTTPSGPTPATVVALRPDGRLAAVTGTDGLVQLVDVSDPTHPLGVGRPLGPAGDAVRALAFAPDGRALAAGTATGVVRSWRLDDPARPRALADRAASAAPLDALAWSPDGTLLAAGSDDHAAYLWRGDDPTPAVLGGAAGKAFAVAFAPDGHTLAVGDADRAVHLWDISAPDRPVAGPALTGPTNWVDSVAFAPDGTRVAAGSSDGTARVWDLASQQLVRTLPHPGPVTAAAYLDAHTLVTAEAGGMPRIWSVPGPVAAGFGDGVFAVGFTADGTRMVAGPGSLDGTASVWGLGAPSGPVRLGTAADPPGEPRDSGSAAITPDGRTLAVGRVDGTVRLYDATDPAHPIPLGAPLGPPSALVEQLAISPDGRLLAASGDDDTVRLWDIARPAAPVALPPLTGSTAFVLASSFGPDGRVLAEASSDYHVYLWSLADPAAPRRLATIAVSDSYAYAAAFSPDGRTLAVGSADRSVRLYDIADPTRPRPLGAPLTGAANYVYDVAWSPDGSRLAAASTDDTVRLWDVSDVRAPVPLATLTDAGDAVFSVAWSPDGRTLAAGSADRTVRLYAVDADAAATALCSRAGTPITPAEWAQYVPDLPYAPPC